MKSIFLVASSIWLGAILAAQAQVCGSKSYGQCVPCCQGTGRSLSTCQSYCGKSAVEKKSISEQSTSRGRRNPMSQ